jgi:8-oxo-dGTP pyrophosphatase MutT (NUDIX family)
LYWRLFNPTSFGAKVIIERSGAILLLRHTYQPNFWSFPGGRTEKGESDAETARREVEEELSMQLTSLTRLGEIESLLEGKHDHVSIFKAISNDEPVIDGVEIAEYGWFSEHDLPVLGPTTQQMYNRYKDAQ